MKNVEINAIGSFQPGEYGTVEVNGVGKCDGAVSAQTLEVNGVLKCEGAVKCDKAEINGTLTCADRLDAGEMEVNGAVKVIGTAGVEKLEVDGAFTVQGDLLECNQVECSGAISANSIKARTIEVDGSLKIEGDITADEVMVDGMLKARGNIAADHVNVDGMLKTEGQVSADHVHVEGVITAAEVVGDQVVIWNESQGWRRFRGNGWTVSGAMEGGFTLLVGNTKIRLGGRESGGEESPTSKVGLIEATTIALKGVSADTVNGTDVTIGPGCVIENLDCNGILRLDPAAQVKNITGEYTLAED